MPIHNWDRVPAGLFHDFHQTWSIHIASALNGGSLPRDLSALVERKKGPGQPEVCSTRKQYAGRANRIMVNHHLMTTVAVIEILSPGNKDSRAAVRDFVDKTIDFLRAGIHLLLVDLFPPTAR